MEKYLKPLFLEFALIILLFYLGLSIQIILIISVFSLLKAIAQIDLALKNFEEKSNIPSLQKLSNFMLIMLGLIFILVAVLRIYHLTQNTQ